MSAFGGKADRTRLLRARANKIRHFLKKYLPSKPCWEDYGKTRGGLNPSGLHVRFPPLGDTQSAANCVYAYGSMIS